MDNKRDAAWANLNWPAQSARRSEQSTMNPTASVTSASSLTPQTTPLLTLPPSLNPHSTLKPMVLFPKNHPRNLRLLRRTPPRPTLPSQNCLSLPIRQPIVPGHVQRTTMGTTKNSGSERRMSMALFAIAMLKNTSTT